MNKIYPPGAGDVPIELADEALVLKPTMQAGLSISRMGGGIRGAIDKVMALDLDMICTVIRTGIGPKEAKRIGNRLEELVYQNGLMDSQGELLSKLVEYLTNIARGGRPADTDSEAKDEEGGDDSRPHLVQRS